MASEEAAARLDAARAALAALADFSKDASIDPAVLQRLRVHYERRIADLHGASAHELASASHNGTDAQLRKLRLAALLAERHRIIDMRNRMLIGDEVLHIIERELDLEELGLG